MFSPTTEGFPSQMLPFSRKTKNWRKKCVDYGDNYSLLHHHQSRKDVYSMEINYDLLNGKIHIEDFKLLLNPYGIDASFIPDNIQHYSIINSKLDVLRGEESERLFDYRVIITNPTSISEIEEEKNAQVKQKLQQLLSNEEQDEQEFSRELDSLSEYYQYEYQDKREVRANYLLNHYSRELSLDQQFNLGFVDAYGVGEESYLVDIVGGEPYVEKIDPRKIRIIRKGNSNKIEDADIIILEDYWSPGRIVDTYWDQLTKKDIEAIENPSDSGNSAYADKMDNIDARYGFIPRMVLDWNAGDSFISASDLFNEENTNHILPYDFNGNVRVLRVYWKSKRKIKKVKSYDLETGEEQFNFYPETYHCDPTKGEEEESFWINEAWEGTKIGEDIYVNMRPRPIQYNRLSNPSRCHFGIIGSIYNLNGYEPYSIVDAVKPYAYLYDVIHDRLNKVLAKNMGKIIRMDFAKVPKGWDVDKWMYYIKVNNIAAEDSFKEGDVGRATGVLGGSLNNASSGVIDASLGNEIQQYINLLEWISNKIGDIAGISRQREGQISNRETVGGVERATLQSSHITKKWFFIHEDVKRRVLECLLETAKIALKGRKKKFEYLLPTGAKAVMEVDGDEFAESDYGLLVENSNGVQELNQELKVLGQAALQNDKLDFSSVTKLYTTKSIAERQRIIESSEKKKAQMLEQQQQQQMQMQQQQLEQQAQIAQQQQEMQYRMHQEDNETKILVAQINAQAEADRLALMNEEKGLTRVEELQFKENQLSQAAQQFAEKLALDKKKHEDDIKIKEKQLKVKSSK